MRAKEARDIPISEFLDGLGIKPALQRRSGKELWYSSPLRHGDSNPSFKVDTTKNLWFDFGLDQGGTIIDLVCLLTQSTVKEALAILDSSGLGNMPVLKTSFSQKIKVAGEKEKTGFELIGVAELLSPLLLAYLQSRQINLTVARHYLKQVCFKPLSQTASHKTYTALGFPSNDGFEVRNSRFKSFVGSHKTITALNLKNGKSLSIFEGFMDFLAFLSYRSITNFQNSVIILNSVSGRKQALEVIRGFEFSKVYLFLDNDQAGLNTTQFFMANIKNIPISDKSNLYRGYKDLNEWLIHQTSSQQKNQKRT